MGYEGVCSIRESLHNVIIYYGKETEYTQIPGLNHTTNVLTLIAPLANKVTAKQTVTIPHEMNILSLFTNTLYIMENKGRKL